MAPFESMDSRWRFLRPWLARLRMEYKALDVDYDARSPPQRIVKVSLGRIFSPISKFQEAYEALALLAAVERVNYESWRYCLTKLCGLNLGDQGEATFEEKIPVRFLLDLHLGEQKSGQFDLVKICGTGHREHPSDDYQETLKRIAAMDTSLKENRPGVDIEVPVKIYFSARDERTMLQLENMAKAENIIQQQWDDYRNSRGGEEPVESKTLRCTFVLEPMIADFHGYRLTQEVVETMEKLLDDNVWFSQVKLDVHLIRQIGFDENKAREALGKAREALGKLIPRLFNSTRHPLTQANPRYRPRSNLQSEEGHPLQIGAIELECDSGVIGVCNFERTCSALTVCQTTTNILLRLAVSSTAHFTRKVWWKWIAYSFFSRRACEYSSVDSLALILEDRVTPADINAFAAVVESDHPEEELFSTPRGKVEEREATLQSGARIRWQMTKQGTARLVSKGLTFSYAIPRVRTFSDDGASEWINVVIPGFSWCQVQRACLHFHEQRTSNAASCNVTSLTIIFQRIVASNAESLQRFLPVVGSSLKYLLLGGPGLEVVDENNVLHSCPNLSKLSLRGKLFDVQLDFSYYRETSAPIPPIKCSGLDVITLANILSDKDNAATKCVYKLRVHKEGNWTRILPNRCLGALLRMLRVNETLELLEIEGSPHMPTFAAFRQHNQKPIRRARNLSIDSKLAVLSVLAYQQKSADLGSKRARGNEREIRIYQGLDQYVLSRIFSFACRPILRQVFIQPERPSAVPNVANISSRSIVVSSSSSSSDSEGYWGPFWPSSEWEDGGAWGGVYSSETDEE